MSLRTLLAASLTVLTFSICTPSARAEKHLADQEPACQLLIEKVMVNSCKCEKCPDTCCNECPLCTDDCGDALPMAEKTCITPPVPLEGCWDMLASCCPPEECWTLAPCRDEYKLCAKRDECRLLCKVKSNCCAEPCACEKQDCGCDKKRCCDKKDCGCAKSSHKAQHCDSCGH